MKLSKMEFRAMNNPIRRWMQKHLEFSLFKQHLKKCDIELKNKTILDIGCGSGYSTELIINEFSPSVISAFDFMPEQIELAKKRGINAEFFVEDVTKINLQSQAFDAAFVFGVLHHVPEWKKALCEIARILKPNGILLIEEPSKALIAFVDFLGFAHPKESKFDWVEFEKGLENSGFKILAKKKKLLNIFQSFLCIKQNN